MWYKLLNAHDYLVPQTRWRVIIVGFRKELEVSYEFPEPATYKPTHRDAIWDLRDIVSDPSLFPGLQNLERYVGGISKRFNSANRRKNWCEPCNTMVANKSSVPFHPDSPPILCLPDGSFAPVPGREDCYKRMSVRECARIQTFPDNFIFHYGNRNHGYKMIGNDVPVNLASFIGMSIIKHLGK